MYIEVTPWLPPLIVYCVLLSIVCFVCEVLISWSCLVECRSQSLSIVCFVCKVLIPVIVCIL